MENIAFQPELRPALPTIIGSKDYRDFRDVLTEMDRILVESGIEDEFVNRHLGSSTKAMSDRNRAFRASTEARIAILTNDYVGTPLRSKGFKNRNTRIEWCILTHNLWKIAAMAVARRREMEAAQAA